MKSALLEKRIDFAVHSFKDMPTTMPLVDESDLIVAAVPRREDARDVLVSNRPMTLADLPAGARVGTGSLRRQCQLLAARPDLQIQPVRGNIDTRLRKQREGEFDGIVLAMAGVLRVGLFDARIMTPLDARLILPAPGQGALALQCRRDDHSTRSILKALDDPTTAACVAVERELVRLLNGDCLSPIGAFALIEGDTINLHAVVGGRGGTLPIVRASGGSDLSDALSAARIVHRILVAGGAMTLLHGQADGMG